MIIDARQLPADEVLETEVCIIGSGPAGLAIAHEFAGQNFRVCILESGDFDTPSPENTALADVELATDFLQETAGLRDPKLAAKADYWETWGIAENDRIQISPDRRNRRFGGNSIYWAIKIAENQTGLRHRPLDEVDFEKRDWLPYSGWPFDRAHLMPYYQRAQKIFGMGSFAYEQDDWQDPQNPPLPLKGDRVTTRMFLFSPGAAFHQDLRQVVNNAENITTYLNANAVELETNDTGTTVNRVRVVCLPNKQFWVSARMVILAVGGIESAQLLLLSKQVQKAGLGNEHDLVGRFFMDHPLVHGGYFIPSNRQLFNSTGLYDMRRVNGRTVMGALGLTDEAMRREKLLNLCAKIFPRPKRYRSSDAIDSLKQLVSLRAFKAGSADVMEHLGKVVTGMDEIAGSIYDKVTRKQMPFWSNMSTGGWSHLQPNREKAYGIFDVLHITEQVPNPNNRVVLADNTDLLGRRKARLQACWRREDVEGIRRGQAVLAEELARAGLGQFVIAHDGELPIIATAGASHHMGTTRMHADPKQGVVDPNCKVHSVSNLYIASGSVFPTGGYANPTLTIVALAVKVADQVKTALQQQLTYPGEQR
jgi:choline dehydrogenase-like flavoprotein